MSDSADSMSITFQGFVTHPGFAKGRMINSMKIAGEFLSRLPRDRMSPETTDGREGFVRLSHRLCVASAFGLQRIE